MSRTVPYPYQKEGVKKVEQWFNGRALLADEMGLGKSFQALYWAWKYLPEDPPGPIVVVCPAHLKLNWKREAAKHLGIRAEVLYGQTPPDGRLPPTNPNQVYIINYDILTPPHWKKKMPVPEDSWLYYLTELQPRLVIADEVHYIKNPQTARSRALAELCCGIEHLLFLSGTPLTKSPLDLWPALNILKPRLFPGRFTFACDYTHTYKAPWGWVHKGGRNLDELHRILLRTCMVRRTKAEVLSQLPAITRAVVPMEVDLREYHRAESDFIGWLEDQDPAQAEKARKAEELTKINYLKRLAGRLKLKSVIDWVTDFFESSESKLLLGAIHYAVTEPIVEAFKDRAVLVDGRMTSTEKDEACQRFNLHPDTDLCVGNLNAAGTGWSCRSTSTVAVCELPWTPGEVLQFEGRIHGLERGIPGTAAMVYYLVAAGTIEEDLCRVLQDRQVVLDQTLDGAVQENSLDVYDQVKAAMLKRVAARQKVKR